MKSSHAKVFLSYAREDGEALANDLRRRLGAEAPDITVWQDRLDLQGGDGWWLQIERAIESVEFMVLLMTPHAMRSDWVAREWHHARKQGVCVFPVRQGEGDAFDRLPRWMRKAHFYDLEREWETFLRHLRSPCQQRRVPFMAPDLPAGYVSREEEMRAALLALVDSSRSAPVALAPTTALQGAGGFGKTTLASALCHRDEIRDTFDDGVLWATLGEQGNVLDALTMMYAALTGDRPRFSGVEDAAQVFSNALEHRNCLIVLDDVWDPAHVAPFLRGAKGCARLLTTRLVDVCARHAAVRVPVSEMSRAQALHLLEAGVGSCGTWRALLDRLAERLGDWPLLLELVAAAIREQIEYGASAEDAVTFVLSVLDREGLEAFDRVDAGCRNHAVSASIAVALSRLTDTERRCFLELAVLPEDVDVPLEAACLLWDLDYVAARRLLQRLANVSLLKLDLDRRSFRLHDVLRAWAAERVANAERLHERMAGGTREPLNAFAWRWVGYHLQQAGYLSELRRCVFDFRWLQAKLDVAGCTSLVDDIRRCSADGAINDLAAALELSAHVLAHAPEQLAPQLVGRLHGHPAPEVTVLVEQARARDGEWLAPRTQILTAPGDAEVGTIGVRGRGARGLAVTIDGKGIVAGAKDGSVTLWDAESRAVVRRFEGHQAQVRALVALADGVRIASAGKDGSIRLWNLGSGVEEARLTGTGRVINALATSKAVGCLLSGASDGTIRLWDLASRSSLLTLRGGSPEVLAVAMTPDGALGVSAGSGRNIDLWDLRSGASLGQLVGHRGPVHAVAVAPDGRTLFSAGADATVRRWSLPDGGALGCLEGHTRGVTCIDISSDGTRCVTGSADERVLVWDLSSGTLLRALDGHSHRVNSVAAFPDGDRIVSAASDVSLKIWDLRRPPAHARVATHGKWVRAITVGDQGAEVMSGSSDGTIRIWGAGTMCPLVTFPGHNGAVRGLFALPDGRLLSAGHDGRIVVWDRTSQASILVIAAHAAPVTAIDVPRSAEFVVSGSLDGTVRAWNLLDGTPWGTPCNGPSPITALSLLQGTSFAIAGSTDRAVRIWDLQSGHGEALPTIHRSWISAIATTQDGRFAASGSGDASIQLWDVARRTSAGMLDPHRAVVRALAFTPDGSYLFSAASDRVVRVTHIATRRMRASFVGDAGVGAIATLSEGDSLACGDDLGRVFLLDWIR